MTGETPTPLALPPVSPDRLNNCIDSAQFWAGDRTLLAFANRMQRRADRFALAAVLLAASTSLAVWTTLSKDPSWWAQLLVSAVALLTAATAAMPRIRNYGEAAGKARELATQYGKVLGTLMDVKAVVADPRWHDTVHRVIADFESIKARKDQLVPYPAQEQHKRDEEKRHVDEVRRATGIT